MMQNKPILTINEKSAINESNQKLNMLVDRVIIADYSDSNLYRGNISSIKYLIGKYNDNLTTLKKEIELMLYKLLNIYFNNLNINCSIKLEDENNDNGIYVIYIDIKAYDENNNLIAKLNKNIKYNRTTLAIDYMSIDDITLKEYKHPQANIDIF